MVATITVHNGHEARQRHNRRDPAVVRAEDHIRPDGHYEIWYDEDEAKAYHRLFDAAQDEYNARQKRADRQIEDYHATIRGPYDAIIAAQKAAARFNEANREAIKAGEVKAQLVPDMPRQLQKPAYETIIGVYFKAPRMDANGQQDRDPETDELLWDSVPTLPVKVKPILKEYVRQFRQDNPSLHIIGVYYHADEQGEAPHVHIDYIPVADGYSRGMERRVGMDRALQQQGVQPTDEKGAQEVWTDRERARLDEICTAHGLTIIHPQAGRGARHMTKDDLDKQRKAAENKRLKAENKRLRDEAAKAAADARREAQRRDAARANADALDRQTADFAQAIDEIEAAYAADYASEIKERRAIQAARYCHTKDHRLIMDVLLDLYRKRKSIPRIPEDRAAEAAHRGLGDLCDDIIPAGAAPGRDRGAECQHTY